MWSGLALLLDAWLLLDKHPPSMISFLAFMRGEQALDFRPGNNTAEPSAALLLVLPLLPSNVIACIACHYKDQDIS